MADVGSLWFAEVSDLELPENRDALVATAFPRLGAVDQPLWDLVQDRDEILRIARGEIPPG